MLARPTVYLVEHHDEVRKSLVWVLRDHGLAVDECTSPAEMIEACDPAQPGCLVIDLHLPEGDGLVLLDRLRGKGCHHPFVVLFGVGCMSQVVEAMHRGAVDCLEKPFSHQRFVAIVQRALDEDSRQRERRADRMSIQSRLVSLTPRQRAVLELIMEGIPTKQIARRLGIRPKTAWVHRSRIMRKMGVDNAVQLVRLLASHFPIDAASGPTWALPAGQGTWANPSPSCSA